MRPYLLLTVALAALALAASLVAGAHRRGAVIGSATASFTAVASLVAMGRVARTGPKAMKGALAVMAGGFLVRIVLVALGTALVARAGESIFGFIIGFFVPSFLFAAIEGAYLHSLSRGMGPTA